MAPNDSRRTGGRGSVAMEESTTPETAEEPTPQDGEDGPVEDLGAEPREEEAPEEEEDLPLEAPPGTLIARGLAKSYRRREG